MNNPFADLGHPPGADDPKAQLNWLADAVRALDASRDPKIRPLKKRFSRVLFQFQRSVERAEDQQTAQQRIQPEIDALLLQVLRALGRTIEQIAQTLRVKQTRGQVGPEATALIVELQAGARQFLAMATAVRDGDREAMSAAQLGLNESSQRLAEPIQRIAS
ncbi:MAG: hypothetical protein AAFY60_13845 [Myxococcota bacterium]